MTLPSDGNFFCRPHPSVQEGCCVLFDIELGDLAYAGPIVTCPEAEGKLLLLSVEDFAEFQNFSQQRGAH